MTDPTCIATDLEQLSEGAQYVSPDDCRCPKCYKLHGDLMYEIGQANAFQSVLNYETNWSVKMDGKRWDLNTKIIDTDEPLKLALSGLRMDCDQRWVVKVTAKNGTVRELWTAVEKAYKTANKKHGDWHIFIEKFIEIDTGLYAVFMGS